jgi:hypothetical protein
MSAVEDYRAYVKATVTHFTMRTRVQTLADKAIDEQDDNMKYVIAVARVHLTPDGWCKFCDNMRIVMGQDFVDRYVQTQEECRAF